MTLLTIAHQVQKPTGACKMKRQHFRSFVTSKYYENRDEYDSIGQTQPHTFEQYVSDNLSLLKEKFKKNKKKVDKAVN